MIKIKSKRCMLIGVVALVLVVAMTTVTALWMKQDEQELHGRYGIVFDVGGSGTRMYLYEYNHARIMDEKLNVQCEIKGATHQASTELQSHITKCLTQAAKYVSDDQQVPIYMAASAGLRLLKFSNISAYNNVWTALREVLHNSSFVIKRTDTLSGKEEGALSWTAVNTLLHEDQVKSGLFEVGSTSFQIAFDSSNTNEQLEKNESMSVNVNNKDADVYASSYLCYGLNEIIRRYRASLIQNSTINTLSIIIDDPCDFTGDQRNISITYFDHSHCIKGNLANKVFGSSIFLPTNDSSTIYTLKGNGNFEKCLLKLNETLSKAIHSKQHHPLTHGLFTAIGGGTYFSSIFLNLPKSVTTKDYKNATKILCSKRYSEIKTLPGFNDFAYQNCFSDTYSYLLLEEVLNLDDESYFHFINKIDGRKVGWPLGLMVNNMKYMSPPAISTKRYIPKETFIIVLTVSIVALIVIFVLIVRSLNNQSKTTSDETLIPLFQMKKEITP